MKAIINSVEKNHTENPLVEIWKYLRLFESEHYSRQFLKEKHHDIADDELDVLTATFSSNVKQAHEYYSAASSVSILTSPLLYYYGMMCLVNVLWVSLNKTDKIKKSHGLWSDSDDSDTLLLSNEYVKIHNQGSFPALHACFSDYPIEKNTKICIKDVLSVIPDLKTLYEKTYRGNSRTFKLIKNFDTLDFYLYDRSIFHDISKGYNDFFNQHNITFIPTFDGEFNSVYLKTSALIDYPLQKDITKDIYFTLPVEVEDELCAIPEASAHFIVMHCLGMLVIYEPEKWLEIMGGKLSSEINLIKWFIDISKRKFPNMILNGLLSKEVQFTMADES